ncbi:MAG: hypothetical protein ACTSYA_08310 [Candidatus Kariarchaeaceae archaeon]
MSFTEKDKKSTVKEVIENYLLIIILITMIIVNLMISIVHYGENILENTGKLFVAEGLVLLFLMFGAWNVGGSPAHSNRNNPGTILFMLSVASVIIGLVLFIVF